jgi:RNA-directed DNA polymerase
MQFCGFATLERRFLGFSFAAGPHIRRTIARKSLERFKQRTRGITRGPRASALRQCESWRGMGEAGAKYFCFCETSEVLIALTRSVRVATAGSSLASMENTMAFRAALIPLGVSGELRNAPGSGGGPWHLARSRALSVGLSNAHFESLGLPSLIETR